VALGPGAVRCAPEELADERAVAEEVLEALERNAFEEAAQRTRRGLQTLPSSVLLHNLAGSILLLTGDRAGSEKAWRWVRSAAPSDGIAAYGLALVRLSQGRLDEAEELLKEASGHGEAGCCLLARQYLTFLRGAAMSEALGLPDTVRAGRLGLQTALAEARGDAAAAQEAAETLLRDPTLDRYAEYPSVLMTFDRQQPLRWGAPRLPSGILDLPNRPTVTPVAGTAILSAPDSAASYVAFRVDGRFLSVANSRPFRLNWNSATVANGPHVVEVVGFDSTGQEIYCQRTEIVTANADAPVPPETARIAGRLWRLLALKPSRASVAFLAWRAAARAGDQTAAARWLWRASAIDPAAVPRAFTPLPAVRNPGPPLWRGSADEKLVALTFDDGPRPGITEELLEILTREQVPATFFMIGRSVAANPGLVARLAQAGMELANHSYSHPNLAHLSDEEIRAELLRTSACIQDITGTAPVWFRPPGGNVSERVIRVAADLGLRAGMWTVNGEQKETEGAEPLLTHVLRRVQPGAVVLLHNGRRTTVMALPALIQQLRLRGYRFVTLSELAARQRRVPEAPVLQ